VRICPFCSTENEVFFRFCLGCGADLDEALSEEVALAVPAAPSKPASTAQQTKPRPSAPALPKTTGRPPPTAPRPLTNDDSLPSTMVRRKRPHTEQAARPEPRSKPTATPAPPAAKAPAGRLVLILEDGTDGAAYDLTPSTTIIGREGADINFPHDDFLAPRHAEFVFGSGKSPTLTLNPLKSTNGCFVQVSHEIELRSGDVFRIGQELLCFELLGDVIEEEVVTDGDAISLGSPIPEGAWGRLGQLIAPDTLGAVYLLGGSDIYLGRERGDITFPGDGFVSGLHAVVMQRDDRYFLKDLGSSNGTYYRLSASASIRKSSLVLAGQQLFRVEH
jgi:pSer/pThr/pTyr-binding forkhead associated (FHA) protein